MSANRYAYLFAAKGIQKWILEGGRLRDIAAASALLASAARSDEQNLLAAVLKVSDFNPMCSRRAGGAFTLHFGAEDTAAFERFRLLWRLAFMQALPGLEFTEAIGAGDSDPAARDATWAPDARQSAAFENSLASLLPQGHPMAELCRRTGRPAAEIWRLGTANEAIDAVTLAKRRARGMGDVVAKTLNDAFESTEVSWPDRMETEEDGAGAILFPFKGTEGWIAVIHADISALGAFYESVSNAARAEDAIEAAREASETIEAAMEAAAKAACKVVLAPAVSKDGVVPARPILLGGDDITFIVRGDLALDFVEQFLTALEDESEKGLVAFAKKHWSGAAPDGVVRRLTAAAGVALAGPKQPFFRLLELAEELCGYAKRRAKDVAGEGKAPASAVAFHRVTESALSADPESLYGRLHTEKWGDLTAQPYQVCGPEAPGIAQLAKLRALRKALDVDGLKPGGLRSIRAQMQQANDARAEEMWERWRKGAGRRSEGALAELDDALVAMGACHDLGTLSGLLGDSRRTPLFDALEWSAIR